MVRRSFCGGGACVVFGVVLGITLFAGCSAAPEVTEEATSTTVAADVPLCMGPPATLDPWLVDSACNCAPGGSKEFEDACSYEQGLVECLKVTGYPLLDCGPRSLPPLWFVLGSDKRRWSALDPGYVRGFGCEQQAVLMKCIAGLNQSGKGPDGAPFSIYPVQGVEVPYCTPPTWGCKLRTVDAFDPCGFRGCIQ
jgi:hypothetical protein